MRRRQPWLALGLWIFTAAAGLVAVPSALSGRSSAVSLVVDVECLLVWGVAWMSLLVPRANSLTVARVLVPTSLVASVATVVAGASTASGVTFLGGALLATLATLHGTTTDAFVDGSSYGPERRFALRVPPLIAMSAVPVTWAFATVVVAVPPLLAARSWVAGGVVLVGWLVAARPAVRSLHVLSSRWIVFVPAGMVIHDPLTIADAVLLPRRTVTALGPALLGTDAIDLSQGSLGLSLQVDVEAPIALSVRRGRAVTPDEVSADRIVFTPLRPGALLDEARSRRIAIAAPSPHARVVPACATEPDHGSSNDDDQSAVPLPRTRSPR